MTPTREEVQRFVVDEFRDVLALFDDECRPDAELDEIGCDSLDRVEIAIEVEAVFDVEFEDDDLAKCKTIGDVVNLTCTRLGFDAAGDPPEKQGGCCEQGDD